jgi:hypothetical protein
MTYPMGSLEVGESATLPADNRGDTKRISRNVSQYGTRNDKHFMCRTSNGVTTITRLR